MFIACCRLINVFEFLIVIEFRYGSFHGQDEQFLSRRFSTCRRSASYTNLLPKHQYEVDMPKHNGISVSIHSWCTCRLMNVDWLMLHPPIGFRQEALQSKHDFNVSELWLSNSYYIMWSSMKKPTILLLILVQGNMNTKLIVSQSDIWQF